MSSCFRCGVWRSFDAISHQQTSQAGEIISILKDEGEWWQAQLAGEVAANQSIDQADSNSRNQRDFMMHGKSCDKIYFRSFHPDVRLDYMLQHILQLGNSSSART